MQAPRRAGPPVVTPVFKIETIVFEKQGPMHSAIGQMRSHQTPQRRHSIHELAMRFARRGLDPRVLEKIRPALLAFDRISHTGSSLQTPPRTIARYVHPIVRQGKPNLRSPRIATLFAQPLDRLRLQFQMPFRFRHRSNLHTGIRHQRSLAWGSTQNKRRLTLANPVLPSLIPRPNLLS